MEEAGRGQGQGDRKGNIYQRIGGGLNQGNNHGGVIKIVRRKRGGGLSRTNDKQHKQNHRAQGKEQGGKARDGEVGRLKKTFTSTRAQERSQNEHRRKSLESGDERRRQELRDQRIGCRIITRRMCASVYASKGGRNEDDTRHDRGATLPRDQQDDEESKK